jgi:hypothetical protein
MMKSSRGLARRHADTTTSSWCVLSAFIRANPRLLLAVLAIAACGTGADDEQPILRETAAPALESAEPAAEPETEPTQWTMREVARRLTDGGLVVTDSGRTPLRHSFLAVEGAVFRVSGSELQVFVYPDAASRKTDSERLDPQRVALGGDDPEWVAPPHLIASGNLLAIHLTHNERLAERVRLILEAWHSSD